MGSDSIPLWIIFIICVIGGAYFAATESSFSAVNRIKIKSMADDGNKSAKGVMCVLNKFEQALTALLVGNNVTKIAGAAVFTILCTDIFRELGSGEEFLDSFAFSVICSALSTVIIFLFSEMIPKSMANDRSESVSLFFQGTLRFFMKIMTPFTLFFNIISKKASEMFSSKDAEPSITEDEFTEIIETAEEEGIVDEEQSDMLKSAIEFNKTTVGDIMTMEKDVNCISVNWSNKQVLDFITNTVHSRLPVRAANSDRIIGVLRVRTFLKEYRKNPRIEVRSVMTAPYVTRETTKIDKLLTYMRQHKLQMAIVQNEHRKVVGLVTIEDILEELVGEIFDEEDIVDRNFQTLGGNKYMVNTHMVIGEIYDRMGLGKAARGIANKPMLSLVLETLGRMPAEDEEPFFYENLEITPKTVENGRLTEVVIQILDDEDIASLKADESREEVQV